MNGEESRGISEAKPQNLMTMKRREFKVYTSVTKKIVNKSTKKVNKKGIRKKYNEYDWGNLSLRCQ